MNWRAPIAAVALALAGCSAAPTVPVRVTAEPVPAQCAMQCTTGCLPADPPQWTGDPADPATWDRLQADVIDPLQVTAETCDAARHACVQCLRRLERVGLICGVKEDCQ